MPQFTSKKTPPLYKDHLFGGLNYYLAVYCSACTLIMSNSASYDCADSPLLIIVVYNQLCMHYG